MANTVDTPCRSANVARDAFWDHVAQCDRCQRHAAMDSENWQQAMREFLIFDPGQATWETWYRDRWRASEEDTT